MGEDVKFQKAMTLSENVLLTSEGLAQRNSMWFKRCCRAGLIFLVIAILAVSWLATTNDADPQQTFVILPGMQPVLLVPSATAALHFPSNARPSHPLQKLIHRLQRSTPLRLGTQGSVDLEAIQKMRIKEIKEQLKQRGVGCDDCFEKADLVNRLYTVLQNAQRDPSIVIPMPRILGQGGLMGPSVKTDDENQYYVFNVKFPRSPNPEESMELIVDTAATVSLISPEASRQFGGRRTGVTASGTAAGGDAATAGYQVSLGPITIGDQPFAYDFRPVVADVPKVTPRTMGILGLDFLSQYDVLFDFTACQCRLYPKGTGKSSNAVVPMQPIPYRVLPIGLLVADARLYLNGQRGTTNVLAILDTGAAGSVMNWGAATTLGLSNQSPQMINTGLVMAGQDGRMFTMLEVDIEVTIGPLTQAIPVRIAVADLPGFASMGIADKPVMLIGADILKKYGTMLLATADRQFWLPPTPL